MYYTYLQNTSPRVTREPSSSLGTISLVIIGLMIRRGNSGWGEGATNDSCRASRRKSIRGAGGVSTTVFAAAVLFPSYCENVTGSYVLHGLPPGASGTPAMHAARYRDVGITRDKPRRPRRAISFIRERRVAADHRVPRGAASRSAENRSPTHERTRRARNAAGHELWWSWCAASSSGARRSVNSREGIPLYLYIHIFVTGRYASECDGDVRFAEGLTCY